MPKANETGANDLRLGLVVAAATASLHAFLAFGLFPADLQFGKYPAAAAQHLAGLLPSERIPDFSPLYFHLHVLQAWLTPGGPQRGIALLQVAAVSISSGLLFLLLRRHASVPLALVGVAAFALNRSVALYSCIFEPEVVLVAFLLLFLWAIHSDVRHRALLAGFAFAAGLATRPSLFPALLVAPAWLYLTAGKHDRLRSVLAFLLFPALVLAALSWRNHSAGAGFSPTVMNPGFVFFEANQPLASGQSAVYPPLVAELRSELADQPDAPHAAYRMLTRLEASEHVSTAAVNRFWWTKAIDFILDHPLHWATLELRKLLVLWQEHRRHDLVQAFALDRVLQQAHVPHFPFAVVSACALVGLVMGRRRWREHALLHVLFALQAGSMLVFYVSDRQRVTLLPLLIVFACIGLTAVLEHTGRARAALLVGAGALAALLSLSGDRMRDDAYLWESDVRSAELWRRAASLRERGDLTGAADAYALGFAAAPWGEDQSRPDHLPYGPGGFAARALALWPGLDRRGPSARFDLGVLSLAAGELDHADGIFRELAGAGRRFERGHLQSSLPQYYRGLIALRRGATAEARRWFVRCLEESPGEPWALAQLAALTGLPRHSETLVRYFGALEADWLVGRALLEQGHASRALEPLSRVGASLPAFRRGAIYLAAAHGGAGDLASGAGLYLSATEDRLAPLMLEEQILSMFSRLARMQPDNPTAHEWFGRVAGAFGHFWEAQVAEERSRALRASREPAGTGSPR